MKDKDKRDIKINIYIHLNGDERLWESLEEEVKRKIKTALNDAGLRAAGYLPVCRKKSENPTGLANYPKPKGVR
ncbi:MAG: hypothetical protein ACFWTJ_07720 [Lachnoclostridium sp.]|jgi:hypothetical protein